MKCDIFSWFLEHKKDINGKSIEIWIKCVNYLLLMHQCWYPSFDKCIMVM